MVGARGAGRIFEGLKSQFLVFLGVVFLLQGWHLLWFAYDVIKNMIMQTMINLVQILIWTTRLYNASLYQIRSYLDQTKREL